MNYGKNGLQEQIRSVSSRSVRRKTKAAVITFEVCLGSFFALLILMMLKFTLWYRPKKTAGRHL